jgi:hypothetical protein
MVRYVKFAQLASASVKIIFKTVSEWRQATPCASSYHRPTKPEQGPAFGGMLNRAVSGDILKKDFCLMTFGRCKDVPKGYQGTRL